jgi:hypothetical protein
MADDEAYYFDGSNGCDRCEGMSGFYIDQPDGPHPFCNCPVEHVEADAIYELRNVHWEEHSFLIEIEDETDNCGEENETVAQLVIAEDIEEGFDEGLREAAEEAGWTEPEVEALWAQYTVPPNSRVSMVFSIERYVAEFHAEVWTQRPDGTEEQVGEASGYFEKNIEIVESDGTGESCDGDLDRWMPRPSDEEDGSGDDSDFPDV